MSFSLDWWPAADERMSALEREGGPALTATNRILDRLEAEPNDPRLGTTVFVTEELGNVSATPTGHDDLFVFWTLGPQPEIIDIVLIHELSTNPPL